MNIAEQMTFGSKEYSEAWELVSGSAMKGETSAATQLLGLALRQIEADSREISRLPALKPGEVVVDRAVLEEALQALHRSEPYVGNGFDHTKRVNDAKALLTVALRAQPTPTEKETDHVEP
jgi:hypothetical protein